MATLTLRRVTETDTPFIAQTDLEVDRGVFDYMINWAEPDFAAHRERMRQYTRDPNKAGWILEEIVTGNSVGLLLCDFVIFSRLHPIRCYESLVLDILGEDSPVEAPVCEVFQLWVAPEYRRQGWATDLKNEMEQEAMARGARALYTHTAAFRQHVIDLNLKLGYREIRRGRVEFSDVETVSLAKVLPVAAHA